MAIVRPNPKVSSARRERLDYLRERLLHLRASGQLRGAPGWSEFGAFLRKTVEMEKRREARAVAECDDGASEREPWQLVAEVRAARRAQQNLEFVIDSVEKNEEQVTLLSDEIQRAERELAEYEETVKSFGGGDDA